MTSTSMTNLSSAYREVIEQYSNENILLNIVRSSRNMPMSFLDIPSVVGTGSVVADGKLNAGVIARDPTSLAGFFSGGDGSSSGISMGLAVNNGFTFTQASLDNAEFMKSFLKIVPVNIVGFTGTQQLLPRAVSYTLLIESIELQTQGNVVSRFQNAPGDPSYADFQDLLNVLIESGLTVEATPIRHPVGPPLLHNELVAAFDKFGTALVNGVTNGGMVVDKVAGTNPVRYQLNRIEERTVMCVNRYRAQELLGELLSPAAFCKDSPKYERAKNDHRAIINNFTKNFPEKKNMTLVIALRSAGNVFNFLGRVVQTQLSVDKPHLLTIMPGSSVFDPYNKRYYEPQALFKIYKNTTLHRPIATVRYKGDTYQIDDEDQTYTKQVLDFMSALLTISKIPGAIPSSPAVIVR